MTQPRQPIAIACAVGQMSGAADRRGGGDGGVADRVEAAAVRRQVRAVRAVRGGAGAGGAAGRQPRGRRAPAPRRAVVRQRRGELHRLQASQLEVPVRGPASTGPVIDPDAAIAIPSSGLQAPAADDEPIGVLYLRVFLFFGGGTVAGEWSIDPWPGGWVGKRSRLYSVARFLDFW
jgi:hypothetical protein